MSKENISKKNIQKQNISKRNATKKNATKKNVSKKIVSRKHTHRRKTFHGQKLFGFVMLCVLMLFLYAFLQVEGYWPRQGGWQGAQSTNHEKTTGSTEDILEIHFIDVGQGDATLIKCGEETMLIDAADEDKGTALQYYLVKQNVEKLDYMVLTHPDSDHIGSADVIVTKFPVENVVLSYYEKDTSSYNNLMKALEYKYITPQIAEVGMVFELGSARCTVLGPVQEYEIPNNASVVLLVEHGENRFLFTGDAEVEAEEALLEYAASLQEEKVWQDKESLLETVQQQDTEPWKDAGALKNSGLLQADVYKAGHHGSSTSSSEKFLEAVQPTYTVISCESGNTYGHPHEEVLQRFGERNIQVYRTDEQGTIVAFSNGGQISWELQSHEK